MTGDLNDPIELSRNYPVPANELDRLRALMETQLLDTEHEAVFDAVVELAASMFATPMATITLIDRDRQWFKASIGMAERETPRERALCGYAILEPEALVLGDAREHATFAHKPYVTGDPNVRFYAGVPIRHRDGFALGALCVIDNQPRPIETGYIAPLKQLASVVERLIDARVEALRQQAVLRAREAELAKHRDFLHKITDAVPALVIYLDQQRVIRFANADVGRRFHLDPKRLIGVGFAHACGDDLYAQVKQQLDRAFSGEVVAYEGYWSVRDISYHYRTHYVPELDAACHVTGVFALTIDISAQKLAELSARDAERRLQLIADNIPAAISIIDTTHKYRFNNAAYSRSTGKPLSEITGQALRDVHGDALYEQILPNLERALAGVPNQFELVRAEATGTRYLRGNYVPKRDELGEITGVFGLILDQTELKLAEHKLREMAEFDALTKLPNRYRLYQTIAQSADRARRSGDLRALLYLDIDKFKQINDHFGHAGGDEVLTVFAERVKSRVRVTDTVARLAGDEFVVLLENVHCARDAEIVAEQILTRVYEPLQLQGTMMRIGTSIGVAINANASEAIEAWLHRADQALYAAKSAGRGVYRVAPLLPDDDASIDFLVHA